jgi:hypothetical protein
MLRFGEMKICPDKAAGFPDSYRSWIPTHLTGQVPLGFGCQESQGVKTQFKPFGLLLFPAALVQFLGGFRREEIVLM